jgi:hypothetical protein
MASNTVPDIGDRFAYDGRTYRVSAWIKPAPRRLWSRDLGPDNCPLMFCAREEAIYVNGSGVCGAIVRVADVEVIGRVGWSEETLQSERLSAEALIGHEIR